MSNDKKNEALETFKANTRLFPNSWNVYDSYGEALLKYGQKEEAIKMYKKSVQLNPDNQNGKKVLEGISKQSKSSGGQKPQTHNKDICKSMAGQCIIG